MPSEGKTAVPRLILDLVERFERNRQAYKSGTYNETQVRREFLDPFFTALGWDIDNKEDHAEASKIQAPEPRPQACRSGFQPRPSPKGEAKRGPSRA
jgi:hypothetical protein